MRVARFLFNALFAFFVAGGLVMAVGITYFEFFDVTSALYATSFDVKLFPYLFLAVWLWGVCQMRRRSLALFDSGPVEPASPPDSVSADDLEQIAKTNCVRRRDNDKSPKVDP
jgi:hypothetical protein